jgi:hypothetical protein
MEQTCKCGREYHPKQAWIHEPCRYVDDVTPNHVPEHARGPISVTETVTVGDAVTEVVTPLNSNAERQKRWRERQKSAN